MIDMKLYSEMVNRVDSYLKRNGSMSRMEAVAYFVGYYGSIDSEKFDLIQKLYCDGFLTE